MAKTTPYRVALLDDHAVVRVGYRRLLELEPGMQVVAEYEDAAQARHDLTGPKTLPVDLLLLDLTLPGCNGLAFLRELKHARPALTVLGVSMHESDAIRQQCLCAGACGVVAKSDPPAVLLDAVRRLQRGWHLPLSGASSQGHRPPPHEQLTERERQVFEHLLAGRSVDEAASRMGLTGKTIFNYQTQVRQKLNVHNAVNLIHYAQVHGLTSR